MVSFAILGDVPYSPEGERHLVRDLAGLSEESEIEFVVHLGDIKTGRTPCVAAVYENVAALLRRSPRPLFILPGDNEWNDCADPEAAWRLWTASFSRFEQAWPLPFQVRRQPGRDENFAFVYRDVLFIGLNLVGGRVQDEEEWRRRHGDNLDWVRAQLAAGGAGVRRAVVFGHARPSRSHAEFFRDLEAEARRFGGPVLYAHGDGHHWKRNPLVPEGHVEAVQVDDGNRAPPVKVTVSSDPGRPFSFDRRLDSRTPGRVN